jgi:DNA-binding MarR family transcriptional regulator
MARLKNDQDMFFRYASFLFMTELHDSHDALYPSEVAKRVNVTYSHIVKITKKCESLGLITMSKLGRIKKITLTAKGQEFALYLKKASTLLMANGQV